LNNILLQYGDYECKGIGNLTEQVEPLVVFLHGYSFKSEIWREIGVLSRLEKNNIPFIAIDMPYGAKSECNKKSRDIEENLILLDSFLEKKNLKKQKKILVGASLGGYLALKYGLKEDSNIVGLLLIGPVGTDDKNIREGYAKYKIPIHIIYGDQDNIVSKHELELFVTSISHGSLKIYENAGHPAYLYKQEEFAKDVLEFYKNIREKA